MVDEEACSLSGEDLAVRLAEFGVLLARAVSRERVGERARFRFRAVDERALRDLAQREQECCAFWVFDVLRDGGDVIFEVGVESPRFAHFVDRFYELSD